MLDNVITLAVDELNDTNTVNHVFDRNDKINNRSIYVGENHELTARDELNFYRTPQKLSGNFRGVAKSAVKFTQDFVVDGVDGVSQLTSPIIAGVTFSVPVGVTVADQLIMRQRIIALLDNDTIMEALMNQLQI
jgi:hypothetical protein